MTDERILKKVGKLLELYGVSPEEKDKFLTDLQDKKYDEEEEKETEVPNEEQVDETEKEEVEVKENENPEEVVESEESVEEEVKPEGEEVETETEEKVEEQPLEETPELPQEENVGGEEEQPEEEEAYDYNAEIEELRKSNEGLSARLQTLEDIVAKLGVEEKDQTMGASPNGNPVDEQYNSAFDEINRKRVG